MNLLKLLPQKTSFFLILVFFYENKLILQHKTFNNQKRVKNSFLFSRLIKGNSFFFQVIKVVFHHNSNLKSPYLLNSENKVTV